GTSPLDADSVYRAQEASNSMGWYESISTEIWDQ
ncbi:MAG: FCSD flavin-binding domain-containing protein, partial [Lautropia mirabilis]|nr:FCSD flavin-binding domain-containing protein [Lautropia mirabilis]